MTVIIVTNCFSFVIGLTIMLFLVVLSQRQIMVRSIRTHAKVYGYDMSNRNDAWILTELLEMGKRGTKSELSGLSKAIIEANEKGGVYVS